MTPPLGSRAIAGIIRSIVRLNITSNTNDYNIRTEVTNAGFDPDKPTWIILTISQGVTVGATATTNAAIETGTLHASSILEIYNNGRVQGKGGNGGGSAANGQPGGDAFDTTIDAFIDNHNGEVWGGGGGGGGGQTVSTNDTCNDATDSCSAQATGGGGGGGAGTTASVGGNGATATGATCTLGGPLFSCNGNDGNPGTATAGGGGGAGCSITGTCTLCDCSGTSFNGGSGGGPGVVGNAGQGSGGSGGAAGKAANLNGNTLTNIGATQGDVRGAIS